MSGKELQIMVLGPDADHCGPETPTHQVGRAIEDSGNVSINGWGDRDITVDSTDAVVVIGGTGSHDRVLLAYRNFVPIISIPSLGGVAEEIMQKPYLDDEGLTKVVSAENAGEAVRQAVDLAQRRRDLVHRLKGVDLDLEIYRERPFKFIRIDPRNPIDVRELVEKLETEFGLHTTFTETGVPGIYQSSNRDIGGYINGQENPYFNSRYFIQDLASVVPVVELGLQQGHSFLETCAARGFKTILAYDLMDGQLKITALDIDEAKYETMLQFFQKFGIQADTKLMDATEFEGPLYDRVFVDAPCSSEGMTVSYSPDLGGDVSGFDYALKFSGQNVAELATLQLKLLQTGYDHTKPGGICIYATCTLNDTENESVVQAFLERNPTAQIVNPDMAQYNPMVTQTSEFGVRTIPGPTKGFYFAKVQKPAE